MWTSRLRALLLIGSGVVGVCAVALAGSAAFAGAGKVSQPAEVEKSIVAPSGHSTLSVRCGKKGRPVAGGFRAPDFNVTSEQRPTQLGTGPKASKWVGHVRNGGLDPSPFELRAYCAKGLPVKVRSKLQSFPEGEAKTGVPCKSNELVVGGGANTVTSDGVGLVFGSYLKGKRRWVNQIYNDEPDPVRIRSSAVCVRRDAAPRLTTRSSTSVISTFDESLLSASCAKGMRVFSGGFEVEFTFGTPDAVGYPTSSFRGSKRTWTAGAAVLEGLPEATVHAYCYRP